VWQVGAANSSVRSEIFIAKSNCASKADTNGTGFSRRPTFDEGHLIATGVVSDFVHEGAHEQDTAPARSVEIAGRRGIGQRRWIKSGTFVDYSESRLVPRDPSPHQEVAILIGGLAPA
jgi:hypothetical protein